MKKFGFLLCFTIFVVSCGYKVKTYGNMSFVLKSFKMEDAFLFEFKKDIEWRIREDLQDAGFVEKDNADVEIFVSVKNLKSITIQSGGDNRQTAREVRYLLKVEFKSGDKIKTFSDKIRVYQKFPASSEYFVDARKEIALDLANQISLRIEAWLNTLTL